MQSDCIFCKIIARTLPARIIEETDDCIVIQDIAPKAPIHYLVIPKVHVPDLIVAYDTDQKIIECMMAMIKKLSMQDGKHAFRLLFNNGREAGQRVFHLHAHFLAGHQLHDF